MHSGETDCFQLSLSRYVSPPPTCPNADISLRLKTSFSISLPWLCSTPSTSTHPRSRRSYPRTPRLRSLPAIISVSHFTCATIQAPKKAAKDLDEDDK